MERRESTLYQRNKKRIFDYDDMNDNLLSNNRVYVRPTPEIRFERSGKWTSEEENFANRLIVEFEAGSLLDCEEGTTLRCYLARRLRCAPMRISKKYAGRCIGKLVFTRRENASKDVIAIARTLEELEVLYRKSYQNFEDDAVSMSDSFGGTTSSIKSDSSNEANTKYAFVSKRQDSLHTKRRKTIGANKAVNLNGFNDSNHVSNNSNVNTNIALNFGELTNSSASHTDDLIYGVDLFDSDSFNNDYCMNNSNNNINQLNDENIGFVNGGNNMVSSYGWENSVVEAKEWLDVLSFFCNHSEETKFHSGDNGMNKVNRPSSLALPFC